MQVVSNLIEAHVFRFNDGKLEFLLMKRSENEKYPNIWQMVTGTISENEKAYQTALREIQEETGLTPERFWIVPQVNSFYSHENDEVCFVPIFAALVKVNSEVQISPEHSEFLWLDNKNAKKRLAWKGQRNAVDTIYEYFSSKDINLKFIEIDLTSI
ncbi:MAG: dATP pyrophosphohydrolase [Ignavibacteria bacterium]|nr:MAG: dATP pyrophosphohydrolase [Ignavibacteria bacterium]KAF0160638.1 MAG: dATP pyrophosphohydrolase [Ignavibacteria bacterium]